MSKSSKNLSDRIFFTINWNDGTAYIGELDGMQEHLVELTNEELKELTEMLVQVKNDILHDVDEIDLTDIALEELKKDRTLEFIVIDMFKDGIYGYFLYKNTVVKALDKRGRISPHLKVDKVIQDRITKEILRGKIVRLT